MDERQIRASRRSIQRMEADIRKLIAKSTEWDEINIARLQEQTAEYEATRKELKECINEILDGMVDATDDEYEEARVKYKLVLDSTVEMLDEIDMIYRNYNEKVKIKSNAKGKNESVTKTQFMKLEKIPLPKFDGDVTNFDDFHSRFMNMIHNNDNYDKIEKLQLLKSCLMGEVKDILRDYPFTSEGYEEAWNYLIQKFKNKRLKFNILYKKLIDIEPVKHESQLKEVLDKIHLIISGLKSTFTGEENINAPFSRFLACFVLGKIDYSTRRDFENSLLSSDEPPLYEELMKFLHTRVLAVEDRSADRKINQNVKKSLMTTGSNKHIRCILCHQEHYLNQCSEFKTKSVGQRRDVLMNHRLCWICLNPNHSSKNCKYNKMCQKCGKGHHTLLHYDSYATEQPINDGEAKLSHISWSNKSKSVTPLPTAVVKVVFNNKERLARVMLDSCSETTLVSRRFVIANNIKMNDSCTNTYLSGVTGGTEVLTKNINVILKSRLNAFQISIVSEVAPKLPYSIPTEAINNIVNNVKGANFAEYNLEYTGVDFIIGTEYYERIMDEGVNFVDGIALRNTKFGVIISGMGHTSFVTGKTRYCGTSFTDLNQQLKKFWELNDMSEKEECAEETVAEHHLVEKHFMQTHTRDGNGRFVVRLPVRSTINELNGSIGRATQMLKNSERRLVGDIKMEYIKFMSEYSSLGHMTKVSEPSLNVSSYYIPHHIIKKLSSTTTKYRVVFNAAATDTSGHSLNDELLLGPNIQPELFDTVLQFRMHKVAFCADIEKMYRQVLIHPDDRKWQRIVWRNNPEDKIEHYELNTVTYGTKPASYLATKCLQILSKEIVKTEPYAAMAIANHFYMDDLMTGADTVEAALKHQRIIHGTLEGAGFKLRKYQSNNELFLNNLNDELIENIAGSKLIGEDGYINVLGLMWFPKTDKFRVVINPKEIQQKLTKRIILSEIARIFDILGIYAPVIIQGKIILQELWRIKLAWDESVPQIIINHFEKFVQNMMELSKIEIPRKLCYLNNVLLRQLIGFSDASDKAYCAVIYLKSISETGEAQISFVCAKSRVTPVKVLSIPRCELLGAGLLAKQLCRVAQTLKISKDQIFAFSDSTIVLSWLKRPVTELKQFVSNRITNILYECNVRNWKYVSTKENPADFATKQFSSSNIANSFWFTGPQFLINDLNSINNLFTEPNSLPDTQKIKITNVTINANFFNQFSNYNRLIRTTAYIFRFVNKNKPTSLMLSTEEINNAKVKLIKLSQTTMFNDVINRIKVTKPLKKSMPLRQLDPYLDCNGVLRVGGRLANSPLPPNRKNPMILHNKCRFSKLMIEHVHNKFFHCNKSVMYAYIIENYHVMGGLMSLIKKCIRNCILCIRIKAVLNQQKMGQLPIERTTPSRAFINVGVDLTGHITTKCTNHRSRVYNKSYVVVFVCMASRAVHLDVVPDLTAHEFINSLKRFAARRGKPRKIFSDNGRNFVGAYKEMKVAQADITKWSSNEGIEWHFIAPRAPHQGGIWEAAVKSAKSLLLRATKASVYNYVELQTVCCQVEAILNSRPIARVNNDIEVLTAGHLLIGDHLLSIPIDNNIHMSSEKRLNLVQATTLKFWKTWRMTYLNEVNQRNKWQYPTRNIQVGDLVLIKEDNVGVMEWPKGKIIAVHPGQDGLVRNVTIKTSNGEIQRCIQRLVLLLSEESA